MYLNPQFKPNVFPEVPICDVQVGSLVNCEPCEIISEKDKSWELNWPVIKMLACYTAVWFNIDHIL